MDGLRGAVGGLCLVMLGLLACKQLQGGDDPGPSASASASAQAAPKPLAPVERNQRVVDAVLYVRLWCAYDKGSFGRCDNRPYWRAQHLADTDLKNDPQVVETLSAMLLEEENERIVLATARVLDSIRHHVYSGLDPKKNSAHDDFVSDDTLRRLLKALTTVPQAAEAVTPIVWIATAKGKLDELLEALDSIAGDKQSASDARIRGLGNLMAFGRLKAFDQVKKLAQSPNVKEVRAAASAPYDMADPSAEEQKAVCPWLEKLLSHSDDQVAQSAMTGILKLCPPEHYDAILAAFKRKVDARQVTQSSISSLNPLCLTWSEPNPEGPKRAPEAFCNQIYGLVEKVADDKSIDKYVRIMAFQLLSARADKKTLEVCGKWTVRSLSEDYQIPEAAKKCLKRVQGEMAKR